MIADKAVEVLETTRLMFEISLDDSDCDEDSAEAREDNEETVEAINEAIKALERQPCTDAISREEALKEMQKYHDDCAKTSEYTRLGFETAMNVVRELPPVTPERPKGEWKHIGGNSFIDDYRCTNCNCKPPQKPYDSIKTWGWDFTDFCPNCGADMRGGKE